MNGKRETLVARHLAEPINYGGELLTRGEVMQRLRDDGATPAMADRWMQGYELMQRIRARSAKRVA
jgi:hypothetical protein